MQEIYSEKEGAYIQRGVSKRQYSTRSTLINSLNGHSLLALCITAITTPSQQYIYEQDNRLHISIIYGMKSVLAWILNLRGMGVASGCGYDVC